MMPAHIPHAERPARFWAQVDKTTTPDGCWLWTGAPGGGYGATNLVDGVQAAHRASYKLTHGEIPAGAFICHHCDVPLCCRPDHLYAGTAHTNAIDMCRRGRFNARKGDDHPSRFQLHPVHIPERLRESSVAFRDARVAAGLTQWVLCRMIGVTPGTVHRIERGMISASRLVASRWSEACGVDLMPHASKRGCRMKPADYSSTPPPA